MSFETLHESLLYVEIADSFFKRLNGLMFRKRLNRGHALLLINCPQVHTCFMRFPIDVVYLSKDYNVLDIEYALKPWRVGKNVAGARHVLELAAASTGDIKIGDYLLRSLN